MHSGVANLPLHPGKAPRWLFQRMEKLDGAVSEIMVDEVGRTEVIDRVSDPFWFQAFSCVLGFDWHSSWTTTVTGGALKQALSDEHTRIASLEAENARLLGILKGYEQGRFVRCMRWIHNWRNRLAGKPDDH